MEKESEVKERLYQFIKYQGISVQAFEKQCGMSNGYVAAIRKGIGSEKLEQIVAKFPQLNRAWLLFGDGEMLKTSEMYTASSASSSATGCIPLYEGVAVGGKGGFDFALQDIKAYYNVPKFHGKRVDFMIEVSGSSMMPKYNSGDVVACSVINEATFIQWNKVHVIATREQGILIKRVLPAEDEGKLRLVSDNTDYPPFDVPRSEICGLALVAGVIRLE